MFCCEGFTGTNNFVFYCMMINYHLEGLPVTEVVCLSSPKEMLVHSSDCVAAFYCFIINIMTCYKHLNLN
jgi:hypothetical protein